MAVQREGTRITRKSGLAKRSAHIDVRMTEAQKEAMTRRAMRAGLDPSTWLRSVGLEQTDWNPEADVEWMEQRKKKPSG